MSDLFSFLKQQTLSSHQALEAHYPFNHMMQTSTFRDREYTLMLQVLLAFHTHTQPWLATLPEQQRRMLHTDAVIDALHRDLRELQGVNHISVREFSSVAVDTPAHARALGAGYVWMGSSLGGKLIERWLSKAYPDFPREYYSRMKEVSKQWPAFIADVTAAQDYSAAQMAHVADTANALFTGLRNTATQLTDATAVTDS